jgi:poly(3-hydroxybutyrate) depolymerase
VQPSTGCGTTGHPTGFLQGSLVVGDQTRTYYFAVPSTYDPDTPLRLVFGFHGYNWQGNTFRDSIAIEQYQSQGQAIFVYPNGVIGGPTWDLNPSGRDIALFDALLEHFERTYCIDLNRVFVYGRSYGAMFSNALACARGAILRAVAVLSGSGPAASTCVSPLPMWIYHGTNDAVVPYANGVATRDRWLTVNQCDLTQTQPDALRPHECSLYTACQSGESVEFCSDGGAHWHPHYAESLIWQFFMRY